MSKVKLRQLIEAIVEHQMLSEEEPLEQPADLPDADAGLDLGPELGLDDAGDDAAGLDLGDGAGAGLEGDDAEGLEGDDLDLDADGDAGGGGGLGGLGGGGGGGFDFGGDTEAPEAAAAEQAPEETYEPGESLLPDDPIQETLEMAINMTNETADPQPILNAVKAAIQDNFEDFNDADDIIHGLWSTEDPVLRVVARKLILFIKGE